MKKYIVIILIIVVSVSLSATRYAGDFLAIGTGVRPIGMGAAFTALANDGSAIYWNPSGIAQIRDTEIDLMRAYLYNGLAKYDNFNFIQPLPNELTIGFNWTRLTIDNIPLFLEEHLKLNVDYRSTHPEWYLPGVPDDYFSDIDDIFQFSFAKHIHYDLNLGWLFFDVPFDFNLGANVKYIKRKIYENLGTGTGFDISGLATTDLGALLDIEQLGKINFGFNFQNVGGLNIAWDTQSKHTDKILFNTRIGFALVQPLDFIKSQLVISTDKSFVYKKTRYYGLELTYHEFISGRLGLNDGQFSSGLSFKIYDIHVDYGFSTTNLGGSHRIGVRVYF
jgi:hypothetical protein